MSTSIILLVLAIIVGAIAYLYFAARKLKNMPQVPDSSRLITLNPGNFQQHTRSGVVLIDFWASWCMPCKMMAPILNEVADEIGDEAKISKVNVEEHQQLSAKFSVRNIPTLILLKNGKEIDRFVGVKTKDFLIKQIKKAL
jgi:thioredoxin 1